MARLANPARDAAWQCTFTGEETIAGRRVLVYRARIGAQEQFAGWVDPQLRFPLQIRLADGVTYTAETVREQSEVSDPFDVPVGFRKFDPAALLERVRQSDVWVEPH